MAPESVLSLVFSATSACAAALNLWLYRLRRSQTAHLWLAISAIGVTVLGVALTGLHGATGADEARLHQRWMFAGGTLIVMGFPRFGEAFLGVELPAMRHLSSGLVLLMLLFTAVPDSFFAGEVTMLPATRFGLRFRMSGVTSLGRFYLAGVSVLFVLLLWLFARNRQRFTAESSVLFATLCVWFATCTNDMAVALGIYQGPLLILLGYVVFLGSFSGILVRRMAGSMDLVERSADHLRRLVERRTDELRDRELQLAHGEKMATIGTLAAGVAHEINTPIAFVGSNLGRLRELRGTGAGDVRNGDAHEILADCREGVDRISAIVSDLLDLARRDETVVKSVELDYIIESALPMVRAEARDRAELVSQLGEVPRVIGDERQLGQIVINLVMNALQSIAPGRPGENRVTVTTRRVGDRVELRVCDTGPGIPDDVRPHIFDPFFTTKASEGTGLGLAVTQQLVGRHRGQITIESSENGTTAIVSLPVESR